MEFVLRMKHWQLFPFIGFFFINMFVGIPLLLILNLSLAYIMAGMVFWLLCVLLYFLITGIALSRLSKLARGIDFYLFVLLTAYSLAYSILFGLLMANVVPELSAKVNFPFLLAFHLAAMIANFNAIRFVAKYLVAAETKTKPPVSKYILEFILLWFLPIGIWFLQPRINKVVASQ